MQVSAPPIVVREDDTPGCTRFDMGRRWCTVDLMETTCSWKVEEVNNNEECIYCGCYAELHVDGSCLACDCEYYDEDAWNDAR